MEASPRRPGAADPDERAAAVEPEDGPILLDVRNLSRRFGSVLALDSLDLTLRAGECLAMMGPNGSGKTTAAELISGLQDPTEGSVWVAGKSIHEETESVDARRHLAYVADTPHLYDDLTVLDHLYLVASAHGSAGEGFEERCWSLLESLELDARADFFPPQLSRGMRQKAALACALIRPFSVLLLDEPVVGLDARAIDVLRGTTLDCLEEGRAVLLMTHSEEFAQSVATRRVHISEGKIVEPIS